jgi:hypothetical protein
MSDSPSGPAEHPLTLEGGEPGRTLGYAQGVLRMACERSHPPGQPLTVTLKLPEAELTVQGKSAGSKRRPDDWFEVQLRLHSLRREQRELLERTFSAIS